MRLEERGAIRVLCRLIADRPLRVFWTDELSAGQDGECRPADGGRVEILLSIAMSHDLIDVVLHESCHARDHISRSLPDKVSVETFAERRAKITDPFALKFSIALEAEIEDEAQATSYRWLAIVNAAIGDGASHDAKLIWLVDHAELLI